MLNFRFVVLVTLLVSHLFGDTLKEIKFGVLSLAPPSKIYTSWKPFAMYLSQKMGVKIKIVAPRGFKKLKNMAAEKKVDIFYVNSLIFYRLKQAHQAVAIAQMKNIANSVTSQSDIFVRKDSNINSISDLKGKKFAFVSPMGAGGYLAPKAFMQKQGLQTKEVFTKNLTNSIYNVLLGKVDAGTMCGVNYKLMSKKLETGELKIIAMSSKYAENLLAARSDISPILLQKLKNIIISMSHSQEGQDILSKMKNMKIQEFVPYDAKIENLTHELLQDGELDG